MNNTSRSWAARPQPSAWASPARRVETAARTRRIKEHWARESTPYDDITASQMHDLYFDIRDDQPLLWAEYEKEMNPDVLDEWGDRVMLTRKTGLKAGQPRTQMKEGPFMHWYPWYKARQRGEDTSLLIEQGRADWLERKRIKDEEAESAKEQNVWPAPPLQGREGRGITGIPGGGVPLQPPEYIAKPKQNWGRAGTRVRSYRPIPTDAAWREMSNLEKAVAFEHTVFPSTGTGLIYYDKQSKQNKPLFMEPTWIIWRCLETPDLCKDRTQWGRMTFLDKGIHGGKKDLPWSEYSGDTSLRKRRILEPTLRAWEKFEMMFSDPVRATQQKGKGSLLDILTKEAEWAERYREQGRPDPNPFGTSSVGPSNWAERPVPSGFVGFETPFEFDGNIRNESKDWVEYRIDSTPVIVRRIGQKKGETLHPNYRGATAAQHLVMEFRLRSSTRRDMEKIDVLLNAVRRENPGMNVDVNVKTNGHTARRRLPSWTERPYRLAVIEPGAFQEEERSWSRRYYTDLEDWQHAANDAWFQQMLAMLKPDGTLMVPNLGMGFNKQGERIFPPIDDDPSKIVAITAAGMKHWDENSEPTELGMVIRAGDTQFEKELWILGLIYGAGPQDTFDLPPDARERYFPIIDKLIADGYIREYPRGDPSAWFGTVQTPDDFNEDITDYHYFDVEEVPSRPDIVNVTQRTGYEVTDSGEKPGQWDMKMDAMPTGMMTEEGYTETTISWDIGGIRVTLDKGPWKNQYGKMENVAQMTIESIDQPAGSEVFGAAGQIAKMNELVRGIQRLNPGLRVLAAARGEERAEGGRKEARGDIRARVYQRYGWRQLPDSRLPSGAILMELPPPDGDPSAFLMNQQWPDEYDPDIDTYKWTVYGPIEGNIQKTDGYERPEPYHDMEPVDKLEPVWDGGDQEEKWWMDSEGNPTELVDGQEEVDTRLRQYDLSQYTGPGGPETLFTEGRIEYIIDGVRVLIDREADDERDWTVTDWEEESETKWIYPVLTVSIEREDGGLPDYATFNKINALLDRIREEAPNVRIFAQAAGDRIKGDLRAAVYERHGWERIKPTEYSSALGSWLMEWLPPEQRKARVKGWRTPRTRPPKEVRIARREGLPDPGVDPSVDTLVKVLSELEKTPEYEQALQEIDLIDKDVKDPGTDLGRLDAIYQKLSQAAEKVSLDVQPQNLALYYTVLDILRESPQLYPRPYIEHIRETLQELERGNIDQEKISESYQMIERMKEATDDDLEDLEPSRLIAITAAGKEAVIRMQGEQAEGIKRGEWIGSPEREQEMSLLSILDNKPVLDTDPFPDFMKDTYINPVTDRLIAQGYVREYTPGQEPSAFAGIGKYADDIRELVG